MLTSQHNEKKSKANCLKNRSHNDKNIQILVNKIKEVGKMQVITSKDNELIKSIKKLKEKKYREAYGKFVIEGIKHIG